MYIYHLYLTIYILVYRNILSMPDSLKRFYFQNVLGHWMA